MESLLQELLASEQNDFQAQIQTLKKWELWTVFEHYVKNIKTDYLYKSHIHGNCHIERVLFFGGLIAQATHCSKEDTELLLTACSYHDVGRIDDSLDDDHGRRSAMKLPDIIDVKEEDLHLLQAAVTAHSVHDRKMSEIMNEFQVSDSQRGLKIAKMLKDADALDRVRVWDLDPAFLRFPCSRDYIPFAYDLYDYYKKRTGF